MDSKHDGERARARAVEQLVDFGLTEYEARSFVALSRLALGTAKEVSELSGVPNSRVYDALDELHEKGFVETERARPRRYRAVPIEEVFAQLRRRYRSRIESLAETFSGLNPIESREADGEPGVWTIRSREHVLAREEALIEDADDEVVFRLGTEDALAEETIESLAAADGDVSVRVDVPDESLRDGLRDRLPNARVRTAEPLAVPDGSGACVGRIVVVDRRSALVSTYADAYLPGAPRESAVWSRGGSGPATGFVHTLCALVG